MLYIKHSHYLIISVRKLWFLKLTNEFVFFVEYNKNSSFSFVFSYDKEPLFKL